MKKLLPALILSLVFNTLWSQKALTDSLQTALEAIVKECGVPGATLGIILPNGKKISLAAGLEDKELNKPMPVGARMLAGSVGKVFFGALALQLIHEQNINIDEKVSNWFKEEDWYLRIPNAKDLTIRMLMNHTTGIPRHIFQPTFIKALQEDPMRTWKPEEMLKYVFDLPPVHPAGDGWAYSDTNYLILGMLIEKWSGEELYAVLRKRILGPLALKDTHPSYKRQLDGLTQAYVGNQNFLNLPEKVVEDGLYVVNPQFEWTGGGLMSNVVDLAKILKAIHETNLIPQELYKEMIQPVGFRTGKPSKTGYGFSTFVWNTPYGTHYGHSGFFPGYITIVEYVKDMKVSLSLQFNRDQNDGRGLHAHIVDLTGILKRNL